MILTQGQIDGIKQIKLLDRVCWPDADDPTVYQADGANSAVIDEPDLFGEFARRSYGDGGIAGTIDFEYGDAAQARNDYLVEQLGSNISAMRGLTTVVFRQVDLGSRGNIKPIKFLEQTLPIIRHHHERMDGRGWPDGLAGVQIPLLVRICTLADAYDAMVSHRPYRDTMSSEEVRRELIQHCGTQFDEELVEIFLRLIDRGLISASEQSDRPVLLKI